MIPATLLHIAKTNDRPGRVWVGRETRRKKCRLPANRKVKTSKSIGSFSRLLIRTDSRLAQRLEPLTGKFSSYLPTGLPPSSVTFGQPSIHAMVEI
jgi:hypothetical protein